MQDQQGTLRSLLLAIAVMLLACLAGAPCPARAAIDPTQGPGGPILVVTSGSSAIGTYYAEILRTEGFNEFAVADISTLTASSLAAYDVVLLARMPLAADRVTLLTNWVNGGGRLIAMAPDAALGGLLGLTFTGASFSNGYLLVDTSASPGNGIVGQPIQFHGSADLYTLAGANSVARLYSTATAATGNPAVTLRSAGLGRAAAFAYDLATSVVYTRQGNPGWAAQERDGLAPIRSDDLFLGAAVTGPQPDWVDLGKLAIPQADEQQRLLANLILHMTAGRKPLPRFWYFPNAWKAVVVMTGDDHGNGGTLGRFDHFNALGPAGCSVTNWECVRGTSYIYPSTPMTDAQAGQFTALGFEVGLHVSTGCTDYDFSSLQSIYARQVNDFSAQYPSAGPLLTQRHHCIVWSDWSSGAQVQLSHGMRLDTSYYFWPPGWVSDTPGLFTGSAMPMRFARADGSLLDVYMAATQMTDESGQSYPFTADTLLDRAIGAEGYYGVYTVNAHTDVATSAVADAVVGSARARGIPIVSARQMLAWLDARNASSFGAIGFSAGTLVFTVSKDAGANGLQGMLPMRFGSLVLSGITRGGATLGFTSRTIKGVDYAFFPADAGSYTARYGADAAAPAVTSKSPAAGATGVAVAARITATFNEAMTASTLTAGTFELRNPAGALVGAALSYDAATRTATLAPSALLAGATTYTATLRGGSTDPRVKDAAGNALAASVTWSFTTAVAPPPPTCPCGATWDSTATPATASYPDANPLELGVKFTSSVNGYVTGIRFYKGSGNTGTHVGNLWNAGGTLLASATFTGETASGWQQVNFASPVAIMANTVYVASYFAPNGHYAADAGFFSNAGVDNGSFHLLKNGTSGGNGVYQYASASTFPSASYNATNYWVDAVFSSTGAPDTVPPTVGSVSPPPNATGVAATVSVSAAFSEAMDPATVNADTVQLRGPSGSVVAASVSYDAPTRTAALVPSAPLAASTTYTATVRGGAADPRVKDLAGNALAANTSWSFTTAAPSACPCTAWPSSATPANAAENDAGPVNVGVKFKSDTGGFIKGIRFYKGNGNTGTHVASLWTASGTLLASATFVSETPVGWQQVDFASPVAIGANTVYVASYFAPNGHYAGDSGFFATAGVDRAPLHLLQDGVGGSNGVYAYGSAPAFPSSTWQSSNYWVDVVFSP